MVWMLSYATLDAPSDPPDPPDPPAGWAEHPRILIDATMKASLAAKVAANTSDWQGLKGWCDANLSTNLNDSYQGVGWYHNLLNYAVAFQATGNQTYGNKGVAYLKALLNDYPLQSATYTANHGVFGNGQGDGNLPAGYPFATIMGMDSSFVARTLGDGVALGRDWLHGASDLDATTIALCATRLATWIPWVLRETPGSNAYNVKYVGNYGSGYFAMISNAALSLKGDAGYVDSWMTTTESMWEEILEAFDHTRGDWDGWNYGDWSVRHYLIYAMARYTAMGDDSAITSMTYHKDHIKTMLWSLHPSRELISDHGRFYAPKGYPKCYHTLDLLASQYPDLTATEKGLARWYSANAQNISTPTSDGYHWWEWMLWHDASATTVKPTAANMGSLCKQTGELVGRLLARSGDWDDLTATWVQMSSTVADNDASWQLGSDMAADFGAVKISARGVYLLKNATDYDAYRSNQESVPLISGGHYYAPRQELWPQQPVVDYPAFVSSFVDGSYAYGKAKNFQGYYDRPEVDLTFGSRSMFYLMPDFVVVYDNFTVPDKDLNTFVERWQFNGQPTTSGQTVTRTVGDGKIVQTYLTPAMGFVVGNTDNQNADVYYADATPSTAALSNQVMMTFEVMDSDGSSVHTAELVTVSGAKAIYVENASKSWVCVCTASTSGANLSGTIVIDLTGVSPAFSPTLLVSDLVPGTRYTKTESPANVFTLSVVGSGGTVVDSAGLLVI